jgi:hypothetical protein
VPVGVWTLGIVPARHYEPDREGFGLRPVGSGPFAVDEFAPNERVTLRGFDGFGPGPPRLDQVTVAFLPDRLVERDATVLEQVIDEAGLDAVAVPYDPELAAELERRGFWNLFPVPAAVAVPEVLHLQSANVFERIPNEFDTAGNAAAWYVLGAVTVRPLGLAVASVVGGAVVDGVVPLSGPAPSGVAVTLRSSDAAARFVGGGTELTLPIEHGTRRVPFAIQTTPVGQDRALTISAALGDGEPVTAILAVQAPRLQRVTLDRSAVTVGGTVNGTVELSGRAPAGGLTVPLSSSEPGVAGVPSSAAVAPNADRTSFAAVAGATPGVATITALLTGSTPVSAAPLTVHPRLTDFALAAPKRTMTGAAATGTVGLGAAAPAGGTDVEILSSRSDVATPASASLRVDAGLTARSVPVTGRAPGIAEIVARRDGTERRDTLTVLPKIASVRSGCRRSVRPVRGARNGGVRGHSTRRSGAGRTSRRRWW